MIVAKIAQIKNQFSLYIQKVKMGETIIVYDRNEPVAQIEMIKHSTQSNFSLLQDLAKKGILKIGKSMERNTTSRSYQRSSREIASQS